MVQGLFHRRAGVDHQQAAIAQCATLASTWRRLGQREKQLISTRRTLPQRRLFRACFSALRIALPSDPSLRLHLPHISTASANGALAGSREKGSSGDAAAKES